MERLFGELKTWHRMVRARYRGPGRVTSQVLTTLIASNAMPRRWPCGARGDAEKVGGRVLRKVHSRKHLGHRSLHWGRPHHGGDVGLDRPGEDRAEDGGHLGPAEVEGGHHHVGRALPSCWMIHSPRSVSTTATAAAARARLRSISSEAIDLDLTARVIPFARARLTT